MLPEVKPNFFIVGAPKCGTTALSEYLRQHSEVYISEPKEPHFFADDFSLYKEKFPCLSSYLKIFPDGDENIKAYGEASVWYLYSNCAIQNIINFNSASKFVVMLRNPIDMAISLHRQLLWTFDEDEGSFFNAWRKIGERKAGRSLPKKCREPKFLFYDDVCSLGAQLEKLYDEVPSENILPICFKEFTTDTKAVYERVLEFLELEQDSRLDFKRINQARRHKNKAIAGLIQRPPKKLKKTYDIVKKHIGFKGFRIQRILQKANNINLNSVDLEESDMQMLEEFFRQDIYKVKKITGLDLNV